MNKHRIHYIFHGDVQGVGFRYTASSAARVLGITGWIKNLYDGTVEMEAQGYMHDLDKLISEIQRDIYIDIADTESREMPLADDEYDFSVR